MKKIILLCALAALAACSEAETTNEAVNETANEAANEAEPVAEEAAVASWPLEAGTYYYTRSDGKSGVNTLASDGTFSNAISGGATETGTWAQEGGLGCFVPTSGDKRCYTFTQPDAQGRFTGVTTDGITVSVRKTD